MLLTTLALRHRKAYPDLFLKGSYIPLKVVGEKADHVVAFAREEGSERLLVVVPRLVARYTLKTRLWENTRVLLPSPWGMVKGKHLFTGESIGSLPTEGGFSISLAETFSTLPVAWMKF